MDSNLLARIHGISVMLFLLTYVIKSYFFLRVKICWRTTVKNRKVLKMIVSTLSCDSRNLAV
ncbi:MAG: hypothetical protein IPL24_12780 [Bacteroidetes bacterium]|nr:hypothetical protein [Bacteroidota bacterium]